MKWELSLNLKQHLKVIGLTLLLSVVAAGQSSAPTGSLSSLKSKIAFLGYARRDMPDLYADFVLRYEATDFLTALKEASNHIGFSLEPIKSRNLDIYAPSLQEFEEGDIHLSEFKNDIASFVKTYPFSNSALSESLLRELQTSSFLDGLNGGLIQSRFVGNAREILQLPLEQRLIQLDKNLVSKPQVTGLNPRLFGIDKDFLTGDQFLQYYREAALAQYSASRLLWLSVLNRNLPSATVRDASQRTLDLTETYFLSTFGPSQFQKSYGDFVAELSAQNPNLNFRRLQKVTKDSYATLKEIAMPHLAAADKLVISLTRTHPYAAALRGCVGDCSSTNASALAMARKEEIYWVRKPNRKIKGYLQFTHVKNKTTGEPALYLNTISGPVGPNDVKLTLLAVNDQLKELGAKKIVIPIPEKFKAIINYPEVAKIFKELANSGERIPLEYLDAGDRTELVPFLLDDLDLPSTNQFGMAISVEQLEVKDFKVKGQDVIIDPKELFPELSKEEVLIIALDLRNRESENHHLDQILEIYGISPESFQILWNVMSNEKKDPVEIFHQKVRKIITDLNFPISWETFQHSPLLFRGHFAAPDALSGTHFQLGFEYLRTYLTTLSELDYVYNNVGTHVSELVTKPQFIQLIQVLFKRNMKEMHRLLDSYELEYQSAYRTLTRLFQAGLPTASFENEIQKLNISLEDNEEDPQIKESIFVRRKTLLGLIDTNPTQHFNDLMNYLESKASSQPAMESDDLRVVSNYFSVASNSKWISLGQIKRINQFILGSDFGLSFTQSLGMFSNNRLDVPKFVDALFAADKYLWAAYLIHKNPWPKHSLAPVWLSILWQHRAEIGIPMFIDGIVANPKWLEVKGTSEVINGILAAARDTITDENLMAHLLLEDPKSLTVPQLKWLGEMSTPALAKMVLTATNDPKWPSAKALYLQEKLSGPRKVKLSVAASVFPKVVAQQNLKTHLEDTGKFGLQASSEIPKIKTINVITGVPQQADAGAKANSGGFGDVAANVVAAMEIKRLHPQTRVRLLVTSAERRYDPDVLTTDEIIKIMVPQLDPTKKRGVQNYNGIEVTFLDCDLAPLLEKVSKVRLAILKKKIINRLSQLIPSADLNLNFSNFPDSDSLLRINATLSIGIEENYGSNEMVEDIIPKGKGTSEGAFVALRSGPTSIGFMMTHPQPNSYPLQTIRNWADNVGIKLPTGAFQPVMAYASEWQAAQIYIYALASNPPPGPVVLFVKQFPELDVSRLPPNVQVAFIKGMPHEVLSAIIQESAYSPLVTGDISLGQALSSVRNGKTLVYEVPPWKVESAARLRWLLASHLGVAPSSLSDMFLLAEKVGKLSHQELQATGFRLGKILANKELQSNLYNAIQKMAPRWDAIDNTLRLANVILSQRQDGSFENKGESDPVSVAVQGLPQRLFGANARSESILELCNKALAQQGPR